ncbi:MAG: hypothetical protein U5K33_03275 [Halofilum sp. (in: g-proteobacteria)]|nr:hypothetical protein [Halofilum sp. (in: g-proteobacteria)]
MTLTVTLFASWAWGFTLNRGVPVRTDLLDRHPGRRRDRGGREHPPALHTGSAAALAESHPATRSTRSAAPTILATFTVIAALLPMAFVTGLMGPYMAPIPINASMGMLISLIVAFMFTPWLYRRLSCRRRATSAPHGAGRARQQDDRVQRFAPPFVRSVCMTPFLRRPAAGARLAAGPAGGFAGADRRLPDRWPVSGSW